MKVTHIPFNKTGFFSKTMLDYLNQKHKIQSFYNNFPDNNGFKNQIGEKETSFSMHSRTVLFEAIENQYKNFEIPEETAQNIASLKLQNTFTITTGHQLNLYTGPLYFLYKIISTINLCEEISEKFPKQNFVPVYWMASEDHDFDEINYFNFQGKKVQWNSKESGAVGRFSTQGLKAVFNEFSKHLGHHKNATYLKKLFSEGYLKHPNLAAATRYIANTLFGKYGLLIVDGDDVNLKRLFAPFLKNELEQQTSFQEVAKTISNLEKDYKIQVNPREINLFYLSDGLRERILYEDGIYRVNNTQILFSKDEIMREIDKNPKAFSPNVIMRPLYQEVILPNLCYIGGGGELMYWLQLKAYFNKVKIPFPILLLRNSVQIVSEKQQKKLHTLNISLEEVFLKQNDLLSKKVKENSTISIDFSKQKEFLQNQFKELKEIATQTDVSFIGAVNAQERKQVKGLENLEKRLLKAEKQKQRDLLDRIRKLQNEIFPNHGLEERQRNFSEYYLEYGDSFVDILKKALKPLQLEFTVLEMKS